jgi:hypothetical protein
MEKIPKIKKGLVGAKKEFFEDTLGETYKDLGYDGFRLRTIVSDDKPNASNLKELFENLKPNYPPNKSLSIRFDDFIKNKPV